MPGLLGTTKRPCSHAVGMKWSALGKEGVRLEDEAWLGQVAEGTSLEVPKVRHPRGIFTIIYLHNEIPTIERTYIYLHHTMETMKLSRIEFQYTSTKSLRYRSTFSIQNLGSRAHLENRHQVSGTASGIKCGDRQEGAGRGRRGWRARGASRRPRRRRRAWRRPGKPATPSGSRRSSRSSRTLRRARRRGSGRSSRSCWASRALGRAAWPGRP